MAFWIQNNSKVNSKWKMINNVLNIIWFVAMGVRFYLKYKGSTYNSDLYNLVWIIWVSAALSILVLNFIHWVKPNGLKIKVQQNYKT